ncbi:putative bifunctional diguanylate cyclase/phosphodiesterase [Pseudomonas ovata]|uniref:putative bifunctional diguanylate cyclase/phosphodiesterase n=1 Tax=Pseudomonas ovata TaxID=1839709 RepID=UPI000D68B471|nr:EAL domain-containing protein [Pseudomonas ovata]
MKEIRSQWSREWVARKFPDKSQWPRIQRLLRFGGGACVLHGLGWGIYYASHGMDVLALLLFALMLLGSACLYLSRKLERFSLGTIAHVLVLMTLFASIADTPTAAISRSTHLFFIPIGVATFLLFRSEGVYLRWVFPSLCFAMLVLLAIHPVSFGAPLELLPAEIHELGHALNCLTAMVLTIGVLAIFREDLSSKVEQYAALARALAQHELCAFMQPQVSTQGRIIGAEVLLRWDRPGHGVQSPAEFIPLAEETGLIHEIGLMVLELACRHLKAWSQLPGADHLMLSVNVSPLQLASPGFVEDVRAILTRVGAPSNRLRLEMTESTLASDLQLIASKMKALRQEGISWSLDDFGTGFSSLSLLQALPLDELKIDQSFVSNLENDASKRELVRKIIEMAGVLGVATIAEGVETPAQRDCLAEMGCVAFQGYLFGRPVPVSEFIQAQQT